MMSHISRMCSRMSSGRPFAGPVHREHRAVLLLRERPSALSLLLRMPSTRFSTSRTLVRYSSSLALSVGADLAAQRRGLVPHAVEDAHVALAAAVLEQAVEGQRRVDLHSAPANPALCQEMCEL